MSILLVKLLCTENSREDIITIHLPGRIRLASEEASAVWQDYRDASVRATEVLSPEANELLSMISVIARPVRFIGTLILYSAE